MKRLALVAAVLAVGACSKADEAKTDTTPPAMAPAAAPAADTGMKMMMSDSAHKADSIKKVDSAAKAGAAAGAKAGEKAGKAAGKAAGEKAAKKKAP